MSRNMFMYAALLLASMISGCATAYQSGKYSFTGGHYEKEGPGKLVKINFSANGFTSPEKAQLYALYRCAEYAKEKGKPNFVIYQNLVEAAFDKPSDVPAIGMVGNHPTAYAYVLLLDKPSPGSLVTSEVLNRLEKSVKVTDSGT